MSEELYGQAGLEQDAGYTPMGSVEPERPKDEVYEGPDALKQAAAGQGARKGEAPAAPRRSQLYPGFWAGSRAAIAAERDRNCRKGREGYRRGACCGRGVRTAPV